MSLQLSDAVSFLAPYVENGQCQDVTIVPQKVNEAAARLWALGDWIGTIQRWAVTVSPDGTFSTPISVQDIRRVSSLADGIAYTSEGVMFMDDADAFLFDSNYVLTTRQIGTGVRKILGTVPAAVDLMVKISVNYATKPTDTLCIDDVYALKMGVLALYYEENNQLELANEMWKSAVAYLQAKTQQAVVGARRTKFTQILGGGAQNTLGYSRARLSLSTNEGSALEDHEMIQVVNEAEEALLGLNLFTEHVLLQTQSGYLSLPPIYDHVYRLTINNCPQTLRGKWFEFLQHGKGFREKTYKERKGISVIPRGQFALHTDLPAPTTLTFFSQGNDQAVIINIEGVGEGGSYIKEQATVNAGQSVTTINVFYDVKSITKDISASDISVAAEDGTEVAYLYAFLQDSTVTRYAIPSKPTGQEEIIRAVARPKYFPKTSDDQKLQCPYALAVSLYGQAILLQRAIIKKQREGSGQYPDAAAFNAVDKLKAEAIAHVDQQLQLSQVGEANELDFQARGFGFHRLTSRY